MVDSSDLTNPNAGRAYGVDAEGTNFPFVRFHADTQSLLADFYLSYADKSKVGPFRISTFLNFDRPLGLSPAAPVGENQCDLIVVDANNATVCNTATGTYTGRPFGRYYLHEWRGEDYVCRAVQHTTFLEDLIEATRATESDDDRILEDGDERIIEQLPSPVASFIQPADGQLDERTYLPVNDRVDTLIVNGDEIDGDVIFVEGFNVSFGTQPVLPTFLFDAIAALQPDLAAEIVPTTSLTVSAIAGAGDGPAPGCLEREPGIRYINKRGPDQHGNFIFEGDACIYVRVDTSNPESDDPILRPHQLKIGNDCTACRKCSDYVDVYELEREVNDLILANAASLASARSQYGTLRGKWVTYRNCTQNKYVKLVASAVTYPNTAAEDQPDNSETYVSITAWLTNPRDVCLNGSLQFTAPSGGSQYGAGITISGTGNISGGGIGSLPTTISFGDILPQRTALVSCAIRYAPSVSGTLCVRPIISGVDPVANQICTGF